MGRRLGNGECRGAGTFASGGACRPTASAAITPKRVGDTRGRVAPAGPLLAWTTGRPRAACVRLSRRRVSMALQDAQDSRKLSRRQFLVRLAAVGVAAPATMALLQACSGGGTASSGGAATSAPAAAAPTTAPAAAAPTTAAAAAAPTSAPAA